MIKKIAFFLALAVLASVFVLVFVWVHHLFVMDLNPFIGLMVLLLVLAVLIPLAVFALRRLVRDFDVRGWMNPAAAFILGGLVFLFWDLVNEPVFGRTTLDIQVHDTMFVLARTQVTIGVVVIMLFFAGIYAGYPRATGRKMNALMGYLHFATTFLALVAISWPVPYVGLAGMPRRYVDYRAWVSFEQFGGDEVFWRWLAVLLGCGQLLFVVNLVYSGVWGGKNRPGRIDKQT